MLPAEQCSPVQINTQACSLNAETPASIQISPQASENRLKISKENGVGVETASQAKLALFS
jgi:hypothetical protein